MQTTKNGKLKHFIFHQCPKFSRCYSLNLVMHYLLFVFHHQGMTQGSQNNVAGIWTTYSLHNNRCDSWHEEEIFPSPKQVWLWGLPTLLFNRYCGSFPGIKRLGREVDHSPKSTAEAKKGWNYIFTPPICLHGVNRDNFAFKV